MLMFHSEVFQNTVSVDGLSFLHPDCFFSNPQITPMFFFLFLWPEGNWWFTLSLSRAERPQSAQQGRPKSKGTSNEADECSLHFLMLKAALDGSTRCPAYPLIHRGPAFFLQKRGWSNSGRDKLPQPANEMWVKGPVAWTVSINIYIARFWLSPSRMDTAFADHLSHVL